MFAPDLQEHPILASSTRVPTPQAAQELIHGRLPAIGTEQLALQDCIGRTLREDIAAERDNPPFDRVCMDGIALNTALLALGCDRFTLQGTQTAGMPPYTLEPGERAVEIMTGAVLPHGADCVIPMEDYDVAGDVVTLHGKMRATAFSNIQRRGADGPRGAVVLRTGDRLGTTEIAIAASAGRARLSVASQPRIAVISTGDELIEPGAPIADHQIRRSNAYSMVAALRARGFDRISTDHFRDERGLLQGGLASKLAQHEILVLSGGVSRGKRDFIPEVMHSLGVVEVLHQIAQRPGVPMWFGVGPAGQAVFGLPGNPVSTLICLIRYVLPALDAAVGTRTAAPQLVALSSTVKFRRPLTYFLPVSVVSGDAGRLLATPRPPNGPGDFLSLSGTCGFVELPPERDEFPAGFVATLHRW